MKHKMNKRIKKVNGGSIRKQDPNSTRIPRFDSTMTGPTTVATTTRIPLPSSLRIQQNHIVPPPSGLIQPTKIISTTKIARPNSLAGIRPPITSLASLKKSLTGEKFTEAASLVTQKTTNAVRKFLTKPEKSEKNSETKAFGIEKTEQEITPNLEKGSKENSTEKLTQSTPSSQSGIDSKRLTFTRSETFVREDVDTTNTNENCPNITNDLYHTYAVNDQTNTPPCNADGNETKVINKTQRYSLFNIPNDMIQSTPRPDPNTTKVINKARLSTSLIVNKTQLLDSAGVLQPNSGAINSTQILNKTTNNEAFLTKTFEKSLSEDVGNEMTRPVINTMKRSETFDRFPNNDDDLLDETIPSERLSDISDPYMNVTLTLDNQNDTIKESTLTDSILNRTLVLDKSTCDKKDMKLVLNSNIQNKQNAAQTTYTTTTNERLIDLTISPRNHLMNITNKIMLESPQFEIKNQTALLYMSPQTELRHSILAPRKAGSRVSLAKTPDDLLEPILDMDQYGNVFDIPQNVKQALSMNALQELKQTSKPRFSFGLDLTESTLDCSIDLCDISLASNAASASAGNNVNSGSCSNFNIQLQSPGTMKKQNSFDLDESLGILTPDQMKEFLDSTTTSHTNNLDLPGLIPHHQAGGSFSGKVGSKLSLNQMRIDLTPSPEELPLDTVDIQTDSDILMSLPSHSNSSETCSMTQSQAFSTSNTVTYAELSQTDTESKTDQMTKSNTSKVSTSFITSITSITSLDNGYQGDGEMSRPASRGGDHSPSNGPKNKNQISRQPSFNNQHIPIRRQDPMTDSDFFTESDADVDIFHRGDRRAQVIDGQLYGPMHNQQPAASVFISEQPEMEDSCMESSGIFTDVENRCDDDLAMNRRDAMESAAATISAGPIATSCSLPNSMAASVSQSMTGEIDMSPDGSTDTVKSNRNDVNNTTLNHSNHSGSEHSIQSQQSQYFHGNSNNLLTDSQTSSTINSSFSSDRISISTDYNPTKINNVSATNNPTQHIAATPTQIIKRKNFNTTRSSPTSNATSPTEVLTKIITEKRAATSPLINAAKIKILNKTNTNKNDCRNNIGDNTNKTIITTTPIQKTLIFKNSFNKFSNTNSVKRSSPSRKHVPNTTSASSITCPSSSPLLSSSPSPTSFINNKNNKSGSKNNKNKITVNSNNRNKKYINNSFDCHTANNTAPAATAKSNMVLNKKINSTFNGTIKTKINTVNNRRNLSNQENIQNSSTVNSSNNSSSISLSTSCSVSGGQNNNNGGQYRSKFPPNKWDAVMSKISENKNNSQKVIKQVKSKISTGISNKKVINSAALSDKNLLNNCKNNENGAHNLSQNENLMKIPIKNDISKLKNYVSGVNNVINSNKSNNGSYNSSINSSFDNSTNTSGLTSPQTKRLVQGAIKRGRSYSKDSQQSSQSDLSLSGGSPKLIIKNSTRSAKKRDVRNLTISPTDLGPPPKTQTPVTTPNGVNRTKIISTNITQKRISPIHSQVNLSQLHQQQQQQLNKSSPPPKKATPSRRVLEQQQKLEKQLGKTQLKDHTRLISQQQQQQKQNGTVKGNNSSGTATLNGNHGSNRIKDNNSTVIVTNTPLLVCNGNLSPTSGTKLRNGSTNSTPTSHGSPNNLQKKHLQSQQQQQQSGQQNKISQHHQKLKEQNQKQQQQNLLQQQQELQQKQNGIQQQLQNGSCKSSELDLNIPEGNKSVEALGVLLQYLVYDLDAFSCPSITADFHKTQKDLLQTKTLLDDVRSTCVNLQDQLIDKDHFYLTREQELQELHRCELAKVETSLIDYQTTAKERITSLETNLSNKDAEYTKKIELIQQQYNTKIEQLEKDLDKAKSNEKDLLNRIEILATNENELRDRIQEAEDSFSERLQASVQRERDLSEKVASLTKQLELTRLEAEKRECELEEKFNLSQNELTIIKSNQSQQMATAVANAIATASGENDDTSSPIRLKSPKNSSNINRDNINRDSITGNASNRVQMLENEVESLRCVMEIKLNDICDLRKKNQELQRANEDYEALKIKYSGMESRIEDLQIQLRAKDEEKQELVSKIKHLQESCAQEAKNRTRVVLHNEELQYRLKQNSEKFNALVSELSKSEYMSCTKGTYSLVNPDNSDISQNSSLTSISARSTNGHGNNIPGLTFEDDDDSPPGSPIIKGVVKKSDSVSWVLQMDDESPEVVASRMVKRAGSFRSSFNEKIQNTKRQFSLPGGPGSLNGSMISPNPLQQSSSGTMLNQNSGSVHHRQHSMSESEYGSISTPRIRSKSVIVKGCGDKKPIKSLNSSQIKKQNETLSSWKEPICSSSPYARHPSKLQRTSHSPPKMSSLAAANSSVFKQVIQDGDDDEEDVTTPTEKTYCRKNSRHLIPSCDKSSTSGATNGMASHSSVTDLKALKKSQPQIQESAGEAMVSGTNSEDESCSQSSGGGGDDRHHCDSPSQSLSSDLSCSNSSDHHDKINPNTLAMEEALLIDKLANSLDGTPMEVSWSSDADAFPSESIV